MALQHNLQHSISQMEANLFDSAIIIHGALGIVLLISSLLLPARRGLCTVLFIYISSGLAFWAALKANPPTLPEVAFVAFAISSCIAIIFLWAGSFAGWITYALLKRSPIVHLEKSKWLEGLYLAIMLLPLYGVFLLVSYAYCRIDWSVPYAERIVKIGLPGFLAEAFSVTGDSFDQVRGLFVLLILLTWTITGFFFVLARKGLLARFYVDLLLTFSFFLLLGGGGVLVALGQARDQYIPMSALFAFPAGYIIAALVGIAAILFVVRHSDTIDFKQPLGALLGFMIVWILPFSASLLVAQVAIGFAHTAFIVDLFSRGDQFWPPFWIWIGRFADLIAVFGLVFGLLKVLRRGRHRDQVVADLLIALLIYENIFREVRAQKQKRG